MPQPSPQRPGKLYVVSGPSGSGKTTVLKRVLAGRPDLKLSVSATTRKPREGEIDGKSYRFLSPEEFRRRLEADEFLECAEVYPGLWYGTLNEEVAPALAAGRSVVLEIDVQGTLSVLRKHPEAVTIFIRPSSFEELERRLRARGTETEEAIQKRLEVARSEWNLREKYRHQVINDDDSLEAAVAEVERILTEPNEHSTQDSR